MSQIQVIQVDLILNPLASKVGSEATFVHVGPSRLHHQTTNNSTALLV